MDRRSFLVLTAGGLAGLAWGAQWQLAAARAPEGRSAPAGEPPSTPPAPSGPAPTVPPVVPRSSPAPPAVQQLTSPIVGGPGGLSADAQSRVMPVLERRALAYTHRTLPPQRLVIPAIGLDARVIELGTHLDKTGQLVWDTAPFAVGHHLGTANPGETGNLVLSGHISSPREGAVFQKLPLVAVGDGLVVATAEQQYLYRVTSTEVVEPSAVEVLAATATPVLTLLTCVPDGVYSHRLVVRAVPV